MGSATALRSALRCATVVAVMLASCKDRPSSNDGTPDTTASPQANAMPAPLAEGEPRDTRRGVPLAASASASVVEGGVLPVSLRGDVPLAPDPLSRESSGYTLSATLRTGNLAPPLRMPELSTSGIEAARKKTELRLGIDLSTSRMRLALLGQGFVWPSETELRARSDRYGHVVMWPGGTSYRPLAPGAMRAFFGERRLDVGPISSAELSPKDEIGKRIGVRTRKVEVATRASQAIVEVGHLADLGEGGILLCRVLLDLMNAPPGTPLCGVDDLPMRAELRWTGSGSLLFEITGVLRRTDILASALAVPPPSAVFTSSVPPEEGVSPMLGLQDLAAFRTAPVDVPVSADVDPEGLYVENTTEQLRLLFIDGVPVVRVAPRARGLLRGLPRGRYTAQWRTFLGDAVDAAVPSVVPGRLRFGDAPPASANAQ